MNAKLLETAAPRQNVEIAKDAGNVEKRKCGQGYKRILLGTDFSPECACVFEQGLRIAKDNKSELIIAHAHAMPNELAFLPHATYEQWVTTSRGKTTKQIKQLMQRAHKEGVRCCHALVLTGFPESGIIAAAKKLKVDLIVIGTHARRGVSRLVAGNVAMHVILHSPCSVLIVRLPKNTPPK